MKSYFCKQCGQIKHKDDTASIQPSQCLINFAADLGPGGVIIMKRSLVLAVSVLALTAVSKPLFAAEAETPAPSERAAPAAERTERARPARERQAARTTGGQQQGSQTSSYTGTQAGGFGGGNVGGGSFADPICLNRTGGLSNGCTPAPFSQSLATSSGGRGGGVIQWTTAVTPWIVVGVLGDLSFGQTSTTQTQSNFYPSDPLIPGQVTAETIQSTVTQKTSGSIRFKAGVVVPFGYTSIMPYTTVGWTRSQIQGTFTYNASNFGPGCTAFTMCSTIAGSAVSFSQNRNGVVFGFGAEMPIPAFGPGVVLVFDYTRAQFGSFDVNLPASIASIGGSACVPNSSLACATNDIGHFSNVSTNTFTVGARFKIF
jgi:hypothetical protein